MVRVVAMVVVVGRLVLAWEADFVIVLVLLVAGMFAVLVVELQEAELVVGVVVAMRLVVRTG